MNFNSKKFFSYYRVGTTIYLYCTQIIETLLKNYSLMMIKTPILLRQYLTRQLCKIVFDATGVFFGVQSRNIEGNHM